MKKDGRPPDNVANDNNNRINNQPVDTNEKIEAVIGPPLTGEVIPPGQAAWIIGLSRETNAALAEQATAIREHVTALHDSRRKDVPHWIGLGKRLATAKDILRKEKGSGHWTHWLSTVGIRERSARNLMKLAPLDITAVTVLPIGLTALYELIRPSVRTEALNEAMKAAKNAPIDKATAKAIANQHKVIKLPIRKEPELKPEPVDEDKRKAQRVDRDISSFALDDFVSPILDLIEEKAERFQAGRQIRMLVGQIRQWIAERTLPEEEPQP
jgi:hypothetical protein